MLLFWDVEPTPAFSSTVAAREVSSGPRFNSDPEHSRRPRAGKESIAAKVHFERVSRNRFQRRLIFSTSSSDLSPMNFKVTCSDSGRAQRASGANPRTPSRKRAILPRMSSSISSSNE